MTLNLRFVSGLDYSFFVRFAILILNQLRYGEIYLFCMDFSVAERRLVCLGRVTYQIEKLEKPNKLIKTVAPENLLSSYKKNFLCLSVTEKLVEKGTHPVLSGFLQAYQEHRPVTISPDMVWLLICQGFAQHVNNNAEALQEKFVDFTGQKELVVKREVLSNDIKTMSLKPVIGWTVYCID